MSQAQVQAMAAEGGLASNSISNWAPYSGSAAIGTVTAPNITPTQEELINGEKRVFKPYTLAQLRELPPPDWLVDGLFCRGDVGLIYGPPGCGKSFLVIDMAMSMCTGIPCFNHYPVKRPLRVLYFAGEGREKLRDRIEAAAAHYGTEEAVGGLLAYKEVPQLLPSLSENAEKSIGRLIEELKFDKARNVPLPDVVIIDTLHSATVGVDENSSKDMGRVLANLKKLAEEIGCAIILVHHTNKGGKNERGSSALRGDCSFLLEVSPSILGAKGAGIVSSGSVISSKIKDAKDQEKILFNLVKSQGVDSLYVDNFGIEEDRFVGSEQEKRDLILKEMKNNPGKRISREDAAKLAGVRPNHTGKLLNQLFNKHLCKKETKNDGRWSNKNPWVFYI